MYNLTLEFSRRLSRRSVGESAGEKGTLGDENGVVPVNRARRKPSSTSFNKEKVSDVAGWCLSAKKRDPEPRNGKPPVLNQPRLRFTGLIIFEAGVKPTFR